MELQIVGQQIDVTDALKNHIAGKIGALDERFPRITQARVSLHIDNNDQIAECTVHIDGVEIHAKASSRDMYQSIDLMSEKLTTQINKHKSKLIDQHR